jgi:Arc/MetJ family transcription regulator
MVNMRVTYAIDESVVQAVRALALRTNRRDSEVVEAALREYLGITLFEELRELARTRPAISLDEVVAEQHAARNEAADADRP